MTPKQFTTLQTARSTLTRMGRLDEDGYRLILKNSGKVESSKDLTNDGFGQVMAVFEGMGFQRKGDETYWRDRVAGRHQLSKAERMRYVIQRQAQNVTRYTLPQMVSNVSGGATHRLDDLDNRQLYNLIEAYNGIIGREEQAAGQQGGLFDEPTPAAEGSAPGAVTEGPARTPATATDGDRQQGHGRDAQQPAKPPARARRKTAATKGPRDPVSDDEIPF